MSPTSYQAALPRSQDTDYRYFFPFRQSSMAFDNCNADRAELMLNSLQSIVKITMTSNQTWLVKYKLPSDQVRTPREIIVTAISQSDAKKVAQAMIPSAIILGGPQPVH
jgi:hypothetical protein